MSFASPYALLWLTAIPVLAGLYVLRDRRRNRFAARWGTPALMPNLVDREPGYRRYLPPAILLAALAALIVGVAKPHANVHVPREEATVLLVLDTSRSMGADDVTPTRLQAAQSTAARFVDRVPKKFRIGVISFSSRGQLALAPTEDRDLAKQAIATLKPLEGTAIGDAVLLATRVGQREQTSDGVQPPTSVLLISDGARDGGRTATLTAAQRARALHIPVYTVLLGTEAGVVRQALPGGFTEVIQVPPSPETLRQIASTSGGEFFQAATDEQLRSVYDRLGSRLGKKKVSREISDFFAGGAGLLLVGGASLSVVWFRRVV